MARPSGAGALEAVAAIDRLCSRRHKGYLGLHAAAGAYGIVHLALRTAVATAAITATATALFCSIPAGFTFSGLVKPFGLVKLLFFRGEQENITAKAASNFFIHFFIASFMLNVLIRDLG
jgi:hypothetical protein